MVGLDKFKEAFSQYSDNCVIIGEQLVKSS